MNKKRGLRIFVDVAMTILLLVLMAYYITGNLLHEWMGYGFGRETISVIR